MASGKQYLDYILERLSDLNEISVRPMMGEYILYYQGKIVGGIYDDRLLIKPTKASQRLLPDAPAALPYEGAKPMILVEETDDKDLLNALLPATAAELPAPTAKKKRPIS